MIAEAVHSLMREQKRVMWENLPAPTKKLVFQVVEMEMREGIDSLAEDMHDHFERLLDLRELVVRKCEENPDLLNQMVFACAARELSFLVLSGAFFGFAFGVVQALVWFFVPQWWVLPFFGFLVGTLTNWIAIQLIFTPLEPKKDRALCSAGPVPETAAGNIRGIQPGVYRAGPDRQGSGQYPGTRGAQRSHPGHAQGPYFRHHGAQADRAAGDPDGGGPRGIRRPQGCRTGKGHPVYRRAGRRPRLQPEPGQSGAGPCCTSASLPNRRQSSRTW